jgi:DNA-binding GntR family transcriptional regulator
MQANVPSRQSGSAFEKVKGSMSVFFDLATADLTQPQLRTLAIYNEVRRRICTNRYPPGELLSEELLASEFKVSRSPIRRVLSRLEQEGLIEIRHGVGSRVTDITPELLESAYEARMALAVASAPFVRLDPPEAAHASLQRARAQFKEIKPGDVSGFADVNNSYYEAVTGLVSNDILREVMRSLFFQTSRIWLMGLPRMDWQLTIERICWEVDELKRAIDVGDSVALGLLMRNHIFESWQRLRQAIDHNGNRPPDLPIKATSQTTARSNPKPSAP